MRRYKASGNRLLIEELRQQPVLRCCEAAIRQLAKLSKLKSYQPGAQLILQGSDDDRLAFIISGRVSILVKGDKVAERSSGQHIGEMSLIDPSARRSATAVAVERTVVVWIEEKDFSKIAASHPELWRTLARELASRLRQRGAFIRDKNPKPEIFIGSSSEFLKTAEAIRNAFGADPVTIKLWNKGVFGASEAIIESLEKAAARADFAILVLTGDDKLQSRGKKSVAPRDNVIFELGLFMGAIGRKRTFMLVEKTASLRTLSDLGGITYLPVAIKNKKPNPTDIAEAISTIRQQIAALNVR